MDKTRLFSVCTHTIATLRSSQTFNLASNVWLSVLLESYDVEADMSDEIYEAIALEASGSHGVYLSFWVSKNHPSIDDVIALLERVMDKHR